MKKMLVFLLVLFLFGCQFYLKEENSPEYKDLKDLYNNYIEKDVYDDNNFYDFINEGTLNNVSMTIKIQNGAEVSTGVIFDKDGNTYYALTIINEVDEEINIYDYKNIRFYAEIDFINTNNGLAVVKFRSTTKYKLVEINNRELFINEMVLTVGAIKNTINNMKLGLVEEVNDDYISLSNLDDFFSLGAPVFNNELKLIGLQKNYANNLVIVIKINSLSNLKEHKNE